MKITKKYFLNIQTHHVYERSISALTFLSSKYGLHGLPQNTLSPISWPMRLLLYMVSSLPAWLRNFKWKYYTGLSRCTTKAYSSVKHHFPQKMTSKCFKPCKPFLPKGQDSKFSKTLCICTCKPTNFFFLILQQVSLSFIFFLLVFLSLNIKQKRNALSFSQGTGLFSQMLLHSHLFSNA